MTCSNGNVSDNCDGNAIHPLTCAGFDANDSANSTGHANGDANAYANSNGNANADGP